MYDAPPRHQAKQDRKRQANAGTMRQTKTVCGNTRRRIMPRTKSVCGNPVPRESKNTERLRETCTWRAKNKDRLRQYQAAWYAKHAARKDARRDMPCDAAAPHDRIEIRRWAGELASRYRKPPQCRSRPHTRLREAAGARFAHAALHWFRTEHVAAIRATDEQSSDPEPTLEADV